VKGDDKKCFSRAQCPAAHRMAARCLLIDYAVLLVTGNRPDIYLSPGDEPALSDLCDSGGGIKPAN